MDNNQISVTTVSLNAGKDIESTINSILNQSFTDYEYLIIDGGSVDATIEIAKRYTKNFLEKGISYRIISEKDEGIYDAMNKAAKYANGEWIIYINAGDALFDSTVLERLSSEIADDLDVIYGDAVLLDHNKYKLLKAKSLEFFKYSNPICHQASLTKTDIVREYSFRKEYEIAADFDSFLRVYLSNANAFKKLNYTFSIFLLGGISKDVFKREKEFNFSRKRNGLKRVFFPHLLIIWFVLVDKIRSSAIAILGDRFYSSKRGWYPDKYDAAKREK